MNSIFHKDMIMYRNSSCYCSQEVYYREEVYLAMKAEYLQYINKLQTQVTDQQDYKSKFKSEQKKVTSLEKKVGDLSEKYGIFCIK